MITLVALSGEHDSAGIRIIAGGRTLEVRSARVGLNSGFRDSVHNLLGTAIGRFQSSQRVRCAQQDKASGHAHS